MLAEKVCRKLFKFAAPPVPPMSPMSLSNAACSVLVDVSPVELVVAASAVDVLLND